MDTHLQVYIIFKYQVLLTNDVHGCQRLQEIVLYGECLIKRMMKIPIMLNHLDTYRYLVKTSAKVVLGV